MDKFRPKEAQDELHTKPKKEGIRPLYDNKAPRYTDQQKLQAHLDCLSIKKQNENNILKTVEDMKSALDAIDSNTQKKANHVRKQVETIESQFMNATSVLPQFLKRDLK